MTDTKHTPGPWLWAKNEDGNPYALMAAQTENYYVVWPYSNCLDVSAANARLIAASPETLAALEELVAAVESFALSRFEMDGIDTLICKTVRSRAAIAKATGQ